MKKVLVAVICLLGLTAAPAQADDNVIVKGAKKTGAAIVWPFKKIGSGMKAIGKKISGK